MPQAKQIRTNSDLKSESKLSNVLHIRRNGLDLFPSYCPFVAANDPCNSLIYLPNYTAQMYHLYSGNNYRVLCKEFAVASNTSLYLGVAETFATSQAPIYPVPRLRKSKCCLMAINLLNVFAY